MTAPGPSGAVAPVDSAGYPAPAPASDWYAGSTQLPSSGSDEKTVADTDLTQARPQKGNAPGRPDSHSVTHSARASQPTPTSDPNVTKNANPSRQSVPESKGPVERKPAKLSAAAEGSLPQRTTAPSTSRQKTISASASAKTNKRPEVRIQVLENAAESIDELAANEEDALRFLYQCVRKIAVASGFDAVTTIGHLGTETINDFAAMDRFSPDDRQYLRSMFENNARVCLGRTGTYVASPVAFLEKNWHLTTVVLKRDGLDLSLSVCFAKELVGQVNTAKLISDAVNGVAFSISHIPQKLHGVQAIEPPVRMQPEDGLTRVARFRNVREFAYTLVDRIVNQFECQQVSLGVAEHKRMNILAISGVDSFKHNSPQVCDLRQIMEEAYDVNDTVLFQLGESENPTRSMPIHSQVALQDRTSICSIPLRADGEAVAVISLRRDPRTGFADEEIEQIEETLQPYGPAIELGQRADRSLTEHLTRKSKDLARSLFAPRTRVATFARGVVAALLLIFVFGWLPYRPSNSCSVVPTGVIQQSTPFEAILVDAFVRSGDQVRAGQLLAQLDTEELELERSALLAKRRQAEVAVRAALLDADPASASIAKSTVAICDAQLLAVDEKIDRCQIRAPQDGMIIAADLQEKIGQLIPTGTTLLTFSPMNHFELEIEIPESLVRHFKRQQRGVFLPLDDPSQRWGYTINSISGNAQLVDGKNTVLARARLELNDQADHRQFRRGLRGFAKTSTGWRPIPWLALHRVYESMCRAFWF